MSKKAKKSPLKALTGIRFWAALYVVFYHFAPSGMRQWSPNVAQFIACGHVAVGLFFILSGFVLTYSYLDKNGLSVSLPQFYSARVARIYPVYLMAFLIAFPLYFHFGLREGFGTGWFSTVLTQITLTQAWSPDTALAYNFPAWSLSAEAFFYLTFPFAVVRISRLSSPKVMLVAAIFWIIGLTAVVHYSIVAHQLRETGLDIEQVYPRFLTALKTNPLARLHEFIIGICLGLLFERGYRLSKTATLMGAILFATVACFSDSIPFPVLSNGILDPLFAVVIVGLASVTRSVLCHPAMLLLGEASYALYIIHDPLRKWMTILNRSTANVQEDTILFFVLYLLVVIPASIGAFLLVEKSARKFLRRNLSQSTFQLTGQSR